MPDDTPEIRVSDVVKYFGSLPLMAVKLSDSFMQENTYMRGKAGCAHKRRKAHQRRKGKSPSHRRRSRERMQAFVALKREVNGPSVVEASSAQVGDKSPGSPEATARFSCLVQASTAAAVQAERRSSKVCLSRAELASLHLLGEYLAEGEPDFELDIIELIVGEYVRTRWESQRTRDVRFSDAEAASLERTLLYFT